MTLKENIILIIIGIASIFIAVQFSGTIGKYFSKAEKPSISITAKPIEKPNFIEEYKAQIPPLIDKVDKLSSDFSDFRLETEKKMTEFKAALNGFDQRLRSHQHPENQQFETEGRTTSKYSLEQYVSDRVSNAHAYLAKNQFDESEHTKLLDPLLQLSNIKGLPVEQNTVIRTTIQMMNELSVVHALKAAEAMSPSEARKYLQEFLSKTKLLSSNQKSRLSTRLKSIQAGAIDAGCGNNIGCVTVRSA